ncbi:MAG: hypothetical protein LBS53_04780 [Synergistaceae bacterium]|jgi:hypothetical protein|nr:hypothetical protein [Synergistaceae bacterium]
MKTRVMKTLLTLALILAFVKGASGAEDGLFEVTVRGRGANEEEALNAAIDEAIRNALGSIFAERSELGGDMLEEKLIQFSRGTATNYRIAEKTEDESGVILTVVVTVDSRKIRENSSSLKSGSGGAALEQWQSPLLEEGQKALFAAFGKVRGEDYINAAITGKKSDPRKGLLDITVSLTFDRERFYREFAAPVEAVLDDIFKDKALGAELAGEFEDPDERYAASFELLGPNLSSRAWTIPLNFWDSIKRASGFWVASKGRIATAKRLWLHFSLRDAGGAEIERIPVHLPVSNVIFFSDIRKTSANPWFYMGLAEYSPGEYTVVTAAPHFGVLARNAYAFYGEAEQEYQLELSPELLARAADVEVYLELER